MSPKSLGRAMLFAALAALAGTAAEAPAAAQSEQIAAVSPAAARIWFYRDYEPSISLNLAPVALNGAVVGYVQFDGSSIYRDVAPGRYRISVISPERDDHQEADIDIGPGQEAYVKILVSSSWEEGGDTQAYKRDAFYVRLVPPQIARGELPNHPLRGG